MTSKPVVLQNHPALHPVLEELLAPHVDLVTAGDYSADSLVRDGAGAVAIIARGPGTIPREVLDELSDVQVIVAYGSGTDTVDLGMADERGVAVVNNAGIAPRPVSEFVIASTLNLLKRIGESDAALRHGLDWSQRTALLRGREAGGRTIGLLGFGHIGQDVARKARLGLDMRVVAYDPWQSDEVFDEHGVERLPLQKVLEHSDVVSIHVPLTENTRGLIDASALKLMRDDAVLINSSRGGVVDEAALYEALRTGIIAGAALDVFEDEPARHDNPLFQLPNVLVTPHIAGITEEAVERLSRATADNVLTTLRGETPKTLVPPTSWPPARAVTAGWPLDGRITGTDDTFSR
jgi:phosphoglycerate dehydrogenase-like enzyme